LWIKVKKTFNSLNSCVVDYDQQNIYFFLEIKLFVLLLLRMEKWRSQKENKVEIVDEEESDGEGFGRI